MTNEQILKPGWKRVKFGDVVHLSKARSANPEADGIERYVGLEHIEPEDLRIRRWGLVAEGTTFTTRFKPGQVLFGKRRAYQRKVAVADFEGVCSGDIYVFESANPKVLLPELLPFICQTDRFFEYAVETSAGSLSPRTNWNSLINFEFDIAPLEEQKKIAELLQSSSYNRSSISELVNRLNNLRSALLMSTFSGFLERNRSKAPKEISHLEFPKGWKLVKAEELSSSVVTKGATPSKHITKEPTDIPFIKVYNLTFNGVLDFNQDPTFITSIGHKELSRSSVTGGDILMNIVGPPLGKIARVPDDFPEANINQAIVRYRPTSPQVGQWLCWYLQSVWAQDWLLKRSKKTSGQRNLTLELCRELPVPIPPKEQLLQLSQRIEDLERSLKLTNARFTQASTQFKSVCSATLKI